MISHGKKPSKQSPDSFTTDSSFIQQLNASQPVPPPIGYVADPTQFTVAPAKVKAIDVRPIPLITPIPLMHPVDMFNPDAREQDKSGQASLQALHSMYVKQKPQYMEAMIDCEFENVYYVYKLSRNPQLIPMHGPTPQISADPATKNKGQVLFKCKEISGCCSRNFLGGSCRPFLMKILKRHIMPNGKKYDEPFIKLERPCLCTCLCISRPYIDVFLSNDKGETPIGRVTEPLSCANVVFNVFKGIENGQLLYKIITSYWQLGFICQCPFKGCNEVEFAVVEPKTSKVVGNIKKIFGGTIQEILTNADNFTADFPTDADWQAKALLLAATLFIDYRYFEEKPEKPHGPSYRRGY